MSTPRLRAVAAVGSACAIHSNFVRVTNTQPFEVIPDNLFMLTFRNIGLTDDAQLSVFQGTLSELLPKSLAGAILGLQLHPDVVIRLVVDHVEALLLQLAAGGAG